ncbi:MAG: TIGR00159 family protein [Clostridiales bacterium]|nr:TIGR00159 family protein [Clostridiales bacterium]
MRSLIDQMGIFFWNVINRPQFKDWLDIVIVAFLIYQLFLLTRETRASQVLKGFGMLIIVSWLSSFFGLVTLNWVLLSIVNNGSLVLLILFQPELRRALERIGRGANIDRFQNNKDEAQRIINEVTQSLLGLSRRRVGALLVFEQKTGLKDYIETGTTIDSLISGPLIVNIFEPNTPLHDGAVIIRSDRIMAAGCVLSLSDQSNLSRDLGTRHRAGLGVTESTDATVLIVSEETGIISMAQAGKLTRHLDADALNRVLSGFYKQEKHGFIQMFNLLKKKFKTWRKKKNEH